MEQAADTEEVQEAEAAAEESSSSQPGFEQAGCSTPHTDVDQDRAGSLATERQWYVGTSTGEQVGPLGFSEVLGRWGEGSVHGGCLVWTDGMGEWQSIGDIPDLLRELDAAAGIGIWSACHEKLNSVARKAGVSYKPSGAGGGDFGLAFSRDAARLEAFLSQVDATLIAQPENLGWADRGFNLNSTEIEAASKKF